MVQDKKNIIKYGLITLFTLLAILGTVILYQKIYYENSIQDYKPSRDRQFILDIFKKNWYWLTANDQLSPENVLDTSSLTYPDGSRKADLTIKVYLENNQPTGFIAYYKKRLYQGVVQFIGVDDKFRGKGYAQKLLGYAVDDLRYRGCINIKILTRMSNYPARAVYTKLGFKELWSNDEYIMYEKNLA